MKIGAFPKGEATLPLLSSLFNPSRPHAYQLLLLISKVSLRNSVVYLSIIQRHIRNCALLICEEVFTGVKLTYHDYQSKFPILNNSSFFFICTQDVNSTCFSRLNAYSTIGCISYVVATPVIQIIVILCLLCPYFISLPALPGCLPLRVSPCLIHHGAPCNYRHLFVE